MASCLRVVIYRGSPVRLSTLGNRHAWVLWIFPEWPRGFVFVFSSSRGALRCPSELDSWSKMREPYRALLKQLKR